jgi:putative hemin transport protein
MFLEATHRTEGLYERFVEVRSTRKLRHRDAAQALGVSEGEAIASAVGRHAPLGAVRLEGPWPEMFESLHPLGRMLALTRNEAAVHEKRGVYSDLSHEGQVGIALGSDIDLRIFYRHWAHVFAVTEATAKGVTRSLQVFDAQGGAIHKAFLGEDSALEEWLDLVDRHMASDRRPGMRTLPAAETPPAPDDDLVDLEAFHDGWLGMGDTHEFFPLLRQHQLDRTQALRLAPPGMTTAVPPSSVRRLLQEAARCAVPIMCFVGNQGMIQIHSGAVQRVAVAGPWLNVLDPGFNLHLREDLLAKAWIVRKPTRDGVVTSLEVFDKHGEVVAMFFGERKPGRPELQGWRALVESLPANHG